MPAPWLGSLAEPLLAVGPPPDLVAWISAGLGALALFAAFAPRARLATPAVLTKHYWSFVIGLALFAALLSLGYHDYYLGRAPRIIDSSTYLLEARAFLLGSASFPVPEPSALFRGRFLLPLAGEPTRLAPIFPPGYPAVLALGLALGDLRITGTALAALLTLATAALALAVTRDRRVALTAALFSALSVTLRYHTADTMSHGLSTLLVTTALAASAYLRRVEAPCSRAQRTALLVTVGLATGSLIATRQLTGLTLALALFVALAFERMRHARSPVPSEATPLARARFHDALSVALGLAPGLALLFWHQKTLTGSWFDSPQLAYYRLADGPGECFGLGLGKGCAFEHADVVAAQGGRGLTLGWALLNTIHRLHWLSMDVANFELLALLGAFGSWKLRRVRASAPGLALLALLPLTTASFYFQGSYPGAGGRMLVELVPLLQVGLAWLAVAHGRALVAIALSLSGFALHASYAQHAIPGAPAPDLPEPGRTLIVTSDQSFNATFDPGNPTRVVRDTGDARIDLLLGRPLGTPIVLEAEADWPPFAVGDPWTHPAHIAAPCVSRGRALALRRQADAPRLTLELTGVPAGSYEVRLFAWSEEAACFARSLGVRALPSRLTLTEEDLGTASALDRVELTPAPPPRAHSPKSVDIP